MLRIYPLTLQNCRDCSILIQKIKLKDKDLADQLKRAITAVPLHLGEASGQQGGHRHMRHRTARGEQIEARTALEVAVAMNYLEEIDVTLLERMHHVEAVLTKLTK